MTEKKEVERIAKELLNQPGLYNKFGKNLKKSYDYISGKLDTDKATIKAAVGEIRKNNVSVNRTVINSSPILTSSTSNKITKPGTYWVTGCIHAPFHNKKMYDSTLNFISKEIDLNGIILAGDIVDLNSLSRHNKGQVPIPGVTLDWEYTEACKLLDQFDDLDIDNKHKYYLYGNHEFFHTRALNESDTSKYGAALKSPSEGLKLADRGYKVFLDWKNDKIEVGEFLDINHGEFFNVHCAKKTLDTYRKSTLFFHSHRQQLYREGNMAAFNVGWGGDLDNLAFSYASRAMKSSWANSSALVTLDREGFFHVEFLNFTKNKLIVNGKEY